MAALVPQQWEFLQDVCKLIAFIRDQGFLATGGELWRPTEMQAIYYERGLTKTMHSQHQLRLAIDLCIFKDGQPVYDKAALKPLGDYWESLNPLNRWGGNFKGFFDGWHFERRRL